METKQRIPAYQNSRKFDSRLELLAREFAPDKKVSCGDVVDTLLHGAKKKRPVLIYEVDIQIVGCRDTPHRREDETYETWRRNVNILAVDFYFYALRLDRNYNAKDKIGSGISLTNLRKNLYVWESLHKDFNHIGLQWPFEQLVNLPASKELREACECLVKVL